MKRANKKWSEQEEQRLQALFKTGHSWLEIGREIGRTAEAVRGRLALFGIARQKNVRDEKTIFARGPSTSEHRSQALRLVDQLHYIGCRRSGRVRYHGLKARTREALAELLLKLREAQSSSGIMITVGNHPDIDRELFVQFLRTLEEEGFVVRVPTNSLIDHARGNRSKRIMKGSQKLNEFLLGPDGARPSR